MRHDNPKAIKLLILYASYGDGHLQAARAIQSALEKRGHVQTAVLDLMAKSHPLIHGMARRFYRSSYTKLPSLYGWMYGFTRPMKHDSMLGSFLHAFGRGTMNGIVRQEQPDAIIYTFPSYALPPASKQAARHIPSFAIITDFDLHQRWVHPRIDRYYVATEDLKTELVSLGISGSRVAATGIPLKQSFKPRAATAELYKRYGLSPALPAVLLMAGADGVTPAVLELGERLLARSGALQVALVCGRNESLRKAAALRFAGHPEASRIRVFGYVEPIHELMSLASCIVTKPGGITLSEAIAANLPIFTYRPAPGQELRNAVYLAERGAAVIASRPGQLVSAITRLLASPERLEQSRSALRLLQTAGAADAIADDILARFSLAQEHVQAVGGRGRLLTE